MRLEFTLEAQHVRAFDKIAARRLRARTKETWKLLPIYFVAWMPFGCVVGTYISLYNNNQSIREDLVLMPFAVSLTAAMVWFAKKYKARLRKAAFPENSPLQVQHSLVAEPGRLEISSAGVGSWYEWSRFTELIDDERSFYLFLGPSEAIVIPKDAFPEPADLQQFQAWLSGSNKLLQPTRENARG